MSCNHDTITDMNLGEDKYVLVYCGDKMIQASMVANQVTSAHTVEVFDTAQELIDKGVELGLTCSTDHLITAMEHGAVLPADVLAYLLSYIWEDDIGYQKRMEALRYTKP